MNKKYFFSFRFFILFISIMSLSCEKNNDIFLTEKSPESFQEIFDSFWYKMSIYYAYWDIDTTDWDSIYHEYNKVFGNLDLNDSYDVQKSVTYFREITKNIIDGHFAISFTHPSLYGVNIDPLFNRKTELSLLSSSYNYQLLDTLYLDPDFVISRNFEFQSDGEPLTVVTGTINNSILLFSCNFFRISKAFFSDNITQSVINRFFHQYQLENIEGVIIDVRNNPGGDLADLIFLIGRLISKPLKIGYSQYKNGTGRIDFTPWISAEVNPESGKIIKNIPIVILGNQYSASVSEMVIISVQAMPNGTFIGDTSYGATGPVVPFEVYNSGSFEVSNFLKARLSSARLKSLSGTIYESKGITPDFLVRDSEVYHNKNRDLQLEYAIDHLNK